MKKAIVYIIIMLIVAAAAYAAMVSYTSNSLTATVTVQSECNDGVDNDGDTLVDMADPQCILNGLCANEDGLTECV